ARQAGDAYLEASAIASLPRDLAAVGRRDEIAQLYTQAISLAEKYDGTWCAAYIRLHCSRYLLAEGQPQEAVVQGELAVKGFHTSHATMWISIATSHLALAYVAVGQHRMALEMTQEHAGEPPAHMLVSELLGRVARAAAIAADGDPGRGEAM